MDARSEPIVARLIAELGASEARVVRAPGRVNLLGGHVDYHEGIIVASAVPAAVFVAYRPRRDARVAIHSLDLAGSVEIDLSEMGDPRAVTPRWGRLVAGVAAELSAMHRPAVGFDAVAGSTLTIGGGLSSSAAFEVAIARALADVARWSAPDLDLAAACRRAELLATGVPCGIQDQAVSLLARAGHALVLDCRDLAVEHLPFPPSLAIAVIDSGVPRTLEGSPWPERRAEGLACARELGMEVLRDASAAQVAANPRGRHVVSEIGRVQQFAAALARHDIDALGPLMLEGHASLRDDMEVSTPELDTLVACLMEAGALGARLTGGGFGGCVVALVPRDRAETITETACDQYRRRTGIEPTPMHCEPAQGAERVV